MTRASAYYLLIFLIGCTSKGEEAQVRDTIEQAILSVQKTDLKGLEAVLASDFRLLPTGKSLSQIRKKMKYALLRYRGHTVYHPRIGVDLDSDEKTAEVSFPFLFIRAKPPEGLDEKQEESNWLEAVVNKSHLLRITLNLRKEDRWQVTDATLERFVGTGFRAIKPR